MLIALSKSKRPTRVSTDAAFLLRDLVDSAQAFSIISAVSSAKSIIVVCLFGALTGPDEDDEEEGGVNSFSLARRDSDCNVLHQDVRHFVEEAFLYSVVVLAVVAWALR